MKRIFYTTAFVMGLFFAIFLITSVVSIDASEPDSLVSNDSLKTENVVTKRIAELNFERCIKCGLCASVCPEGAIKMVDHKPIIDPQKCTATETCVKRCPTRALSMVEIKVPKVDIKDEASSDSVSEMKNKTEDE